MYDIELLKTAVDTRNRLIKEAAEAEERLTNMVPRDAVEKAIREQVAARKQVAEEYGDKWYNGIQHYPVETMHWDYTVLSVDGDGQWAEVQTSHLVCGRSGHTKHTIKVGLTKAAEKMIVAELQGSDRRHRREEAKRVLAEEKKRLEREMKGLELEMTSLGLD